MKEYKNKKPVDPSLDSKEDEVDPVFSYYHLPSNTNEKQRKKDVRILKHECNNFFL